VVKTVVIMELPEEMGSHPEARSEDGASCAGGARSGERPRIWRVVSVEVEQRKTDQAVILKVSGEVEMKTSPELRRHLIALAGEKTPWIIVNLEDVTYIDSSGLATIVECLQGAKKYSGRLSLTGMNENIKDIFVMTRLDTIFEVFETEEDALASETA